MDDSEIIERAKKRYALAEEAERENRREAAEDKRFAAGDQWPEDIRKSRETEQRPALVINRVQQMVKQVVNDMRQNRPAIKVHPVDSGADVAVAEVLNGLIRHIENDSSASDAYDYGGECAVDGGFGFIRIITEYEPNSFNQCIKIIRVRNPFTCHIDPLAQDAVGQDAKWGIVIDDMPKTEFKSKHPNAKERDYETDKDAPDWINAETVRVAEYFEVEEKEDTLYLLIDGTTAKLSEMPGKPPKGMIKKERKITSNAVKWYKITGAEILETTDWPGQYIPIIPVYGEEHDIEGKVIRFGLVRHAKDPQRIYNYSRTSAVEQVALAPKAPYVIAEGQVEGYEDVWATANTANHAYLPYKPTTVAGVQVSPPQRQGFSGVPVGSISDLQLAGEEIKAVTGIYDASLGQRSNETSGIAIQRRNAQADNATFHFVDNLARSIRYVGRQLVDMIPRIYDTPRTIRIIGVDGAESMAAINTPDPMTGQKINPLDVGRYDVTVDVGPSFQTRRIEAAESMTAFVQAFPPAAQVAGDLIAKAMDWPDADEIAKRLRAAMPPGIVQDEENGEAVPPQIQAKMQEQMQVIQGLQQAMQQAQAELQKAAQVAESNDQEIQIKLAELQLKAREIGVKESDAQVKQGELQLKARDQEIEAARMMMEGREESMEGKEQPQQPQMQPIVIQQSDAATQMLQSMMQQLQGQLQTLQQTQNEMAASLQTVSVKEIRSPEGKLIGGVQVKADGSEVPVMFN